jgi:hypothetical protein
VCREQRLEARDEDGRAAVVAAGADRVVADDDLALGARAASAAFSQPSWACRSGSETRPRDSRTSASASPPSIGVVSRTKMSSWGMPNSAPETAKYPRRHPPARIAAGIGELRARVAAVVVVAEAHESTASAAPAPCRRPRTTPSQWSSVGGLDAHG